MVVPIAVLVFASVALLVWAIFQPKEDVVARRLPAAPYREMVRERRLAGGPGKRLLSPVLVQIGVVLRSLLPHHVIHRLEKLLIMAGEPMTLPVFLSIWAVSTVLGLLIVYLTWTSLPVPTGVRFLLAIYLLLFFGLGPYLLVRRQVRKRHQTIARELPDAIDLLVTCVEAGLGIDAAFARVTEKTQGLISETFRLYMRQVSLGRGRQEALMDIAERSGVPDLIRLATSVKQAEDIGITIGDVLRTQAADLRTLRRQRAQEAAQKAPIKMSIPLVLCFMPAVFAVVVVPSILNLLRVFSNGGLGPLR
jgi:tight adherence protein C